MLFITDHQCVASNNVISRLAPPQRLQHEPIIRPEHPWEEYGTYFQGSVLKDGDTFRLWYSAIGKARREQQYLGYAESCDGVNYRKIIRPEFAHGEWPATNILYGQNFNISAPNVHFYHEPRGEYRYFLTFDSRVEQHADRAVTRQSTLTPGDRHRYMNHPAYPADYDWNRYFGEETWRAVYVADSVDGINWEPADARFAIPGQSDGDHTVVWDPAARLYRMYLRANRVDENGDRIRQVMHATSPDTIEWSQPVLCLESDAIDDPRVNQIHGMTVTYHEGVFIGLVQMLEIEEEVVSWNPIAPFERGRFHVQLAVSYDGLHFHRVADRAEYFGTGEPGNWDGGMVRSGGQWVFDGDRMLMYYDGRNCKHTAAPGEPYIVGIGVAAAPRDRFAGLTPRDAVRPGDIVVALPAGANALHLNADVPPGSSITASLRYPDGCKVRGYTEAECISIHEGGLRMPFTWNTKAPRPAAPLHLRLRLHGDAMVYALYHD